MCDELGMFFVVAWGFPMPGGALCWAFLRTGWVITGLNIYKTVKGTV